MIRPLLSSACVTAAALGALAPFAAAQQSVPVTRMSDPTATFKEPFSEIRGLRELDDGRVLISDALEQSLVLADFRTGAERKIGRQGGGPGEYTDPGPLFALAGDTTLMLDMGNPRGLVIAPSGEIGRSFPLTLGSGIPFFPRGVDAEGRLYGEPPFTIVNGQVSGSADSTVVVRWDARGSDTADTVARLATQSQNVVRMRMGGAGGGGAPSIATGAHPFAPSDGWAVAPDGRVAVVRADDYHVEWIRPDGRKTAGPTVSYTPVSIARADKEAWADRQTQARMVLRTPQGTRTMHPPRPDPDKISWPDVKPPFAPRGVFVTPDGELWVERYEAANQPETYDVFDATGTRVTQVVLPKDRELAGFGRGTVYLVHKDSDDLEWLEKYQRQ
jgi:hypothetical protein